MTVGSVRSAKQTPPASVVDSVKAAAEASAAYAAAPSPSRCLTSGKLWRNQAVGSRAATQAFSFYVTPNTNHMTGLLGLSQGAATAPKDLSPIVLFDESGTIKAANGSTYQAATSVPYRAGVQYHIRIVLDLAADKYDAAVAAPGTQGVTIANNFKFYQEKTNIAAPDAVAFNSPTGSMKVCWTFPEPAFSYEYAREAWNTTGRKWLSKYGGIGWDGRQWVFDESWAESPANVAQSAYTLEHALRAGINLGYFRPDPLLLDEIAQFLVVYKARFTTVGGLRAMTQHDTRLLNNAGSNEKRTLSWIQPRSSGLARVRECTLCNGQFYHPVARLVRFIAAMPPSARTASMNEVANWYGSLLTNDWLMWELFGDPNRIAAWNAIAQDSVSGNWPGPFLGDNEMWVLATAAEILGANQNDPALVPLTFTQKAQLQRALRYGVSALNRYRTSYPATKNFQGITVGSMTYFNGMLADHPDNAHAGHVNASYPSSVQTKRAPEVSLDISHYYRVPVLLRTLRDNRAATGVSTPSDVDIRRLINHYLYRNFTGDFDTPLFRNFFDGTNGWYRVGYHRYGAGYSPVQYCNARDKVGSYSHFCLFNPGGLMGWGLLAQLSPDLMELQHNFLKLAWDEHPSRVTFKDQFYYYTMPFSPRNASGQAQYPPSLLWIMGGIPDALH